MVLLKREITDDFFFRLLEAGFLDKLLEDFFLAIVYIEIMFEL